MAETGSAVARRLGEVGGRTLIIVALVVVAIAALYRLDLRLDWSADERFSIQAPLADIVEGLEDPVHAVAIWSPESGDAVHDSLIEYVDARLRQISQLSSRLEHTVIDAVVDQPAVEAFRAEHGEAMPDSIYLVGHGRPFRLPVTEMLRYTLQRDLGGALVTVSTRERIPIYVLQGHGELAWRGEGDDTLGHFLHRLNLAGMEFDPTRHALDAAALSRLGRIPGDGVLVVAGPTAPLGSEALAALAAYLRDGGPALFLLDHRAPDDLTLLLRRWGLLVAGGVPRDLATIDRAGGRAPVVVRSLDRSLRGADRDFTRLLLGPENLNDHPATAQTRRSGRLIASPSSTEVQAIAWARYLEHQGEAAPEALSQWVAAAAGPPPLQLDRLFALDPADAWLAAPGDRTPPSGSQQRQPIELGYAAIYAPHPESANPEHGPRIAIWGSREAASDRWVADPQYANDLLLTDLVAWLADRGESTPIAIQRFASYQVEAEEGTLTLLMALLVAVIPCLCIGVAILAWWERR